MKIGIYQTSIEWENREKNIQKLANQLSNLKPGTIDAIFLPEMSFTGFSMNTKITGEEHEETKKQISILCKENQIAIGFGWVKNKKMSENHYTVIGQNGEELSDYIKIHPFSYSGENQFFTCGSSVSYFSLKGVKFCSFICYDLRFPELFRIASKKADIIIVPANWPQKRNKHWEILLQARAIENQIYIVGINCVGNIGGLNYCGNSCMIAPDGEVIMK